MMSRIINSLLMALWVSSLIVAQEKSIEHSPSVLKEKFRFEHLAKIKNEITGSNDKADKPLTAQQQEELLKKYYFELYQLGCASFNPSTQEIKKLWNTIPSELRRELINKSWCTTTHAKKVSFVYYVTPNIAWCELLELFIDEGLDVTTSINSSEDTLLHRFADINTINVEQDYDRNAIEQLIEKIIAAGANIDAQNKVGKTPLHKAYEHQNIQLVQLLIELGAAKLIRDEWNRIPRSYLAIN